MKVALIAPHRRVEDSYRHSSEYLFLNRGEHRKFCVRAGPLDATVAARRDFPWELRPT